MVHHMTWYVLYDMVTLLGDIVLYTTSTWYGSTHTTSGVLGTVYCTGHHTYTYVCMSGSMIHSMYTWSSIYRYTVCTYGDIILTHILPMLVLVYSMLCWYATLV